MAELTHSYEAYVRCTPEAAWRSMVDGDETVRYYYGTRVESDFTPGSPIRYHSASGDLVADGEILVADENRRLEMMFHPRWDPELEAEGAVHSAWLIEPAEGLTLVRVEYYALSPDSNTYGNFVEGTPFIVSGMKTWLETGEPMAG